MQLKITLFCLNTKTFCTKFYVIGLCNFQTPDLLSMDSVNDYRSLLKPMDH